MTLNATDRYRVRPRVWIGVVIYLAYVAVVFGVQQIFGIPYTDFGKSGINLFLGAGLSLIVSAILLAITTTLLGWWRPALFDRHRSAHKWPIIAPFLMVVALVLNLASTDWGSYDGAFFAASIVLLLVGFTEELTTRGLLIVGLRSRLSEVWVWLLTSALFGLMHLVNALTGQAIGPTVQQVGLAFGAGTIFYILRRVTGSLIWAMVLHGLWDFSTFGLGHGTPGPFFALGGTLEIIAIVVAFIGVAFVIRGADERITATSPTAS
ncbi:CPBP family intramembrane glutamic endopeptidase [Microbacterium rhizomatis]|uniref:CPBP family intramembrane metalloprotease n=1 Tax=Microbacterium rhizomatis TaxID=1631477 RepID=A0A5J5J6J1_9MICO|nr:CPBP family intramembrane glutamic endopeptidase [Microbacterium rhizomatis]KAA9110403.1 CPBP family intramembrane metalloprotease [Microbacterium rhizomatis]